MSRVVDADELIKALNNHCELVTENVREDLAKNIYKLAYKHVTEVINTCADRGGVLT